MRESDSDGWSCGGYGEGEMEVEREREGKRETSFVYTAPALRDRFVNVDEKPLEMDV